MPLPPAAVDPCECSELLLADTSTPLRTDDVPVFSYSTFPNVKYLSVSRPAASTGGGKGPRMPVMRASIEDTESF